MSQSVPKMDVLTGNDVKSTPIGGADFQTALFMAQGLNMSKEETKALIGKTKMAALDAYIDIMNNGNEGMQARVRQTFGEGLPAVNGFIEFFARNEKRWAEDALAKAIFGDKSSYVQKSTNGGIRFADARAAAAAEESDDETDRRTSSLL